MPEFVYTDIVLKHLEKSLSPERLGRYLSLADGDMEKAVRLHLWNSALGGQLHTPMQNFELLFRNALNGQYRQNYLLNLKFGELCITVT